MLYVLDGKQTAEGNEGAHSGAVPRDNARGRGLENTLQSAHRQVQDLGEHCNGILYAAEKTFPLARGFL